MKFKAKFLGRFESSFKNDKGEMTPFYKLSFLPLDGGGLPILVKAKESGYRAFEDVDPLEEVEVEFSVNGDSIMHIIG